MKWAPEEVDKLIELFPNNKIEDISKILGKNYKSVRNKVFALSLKRISEQKLKFAKSKICEYRLSFDDLLSIAQKYKSRSEFYNARPFEYDGIFWHKNKDRDNLKDSICDNIGIKLLRISGEKLI